MEKDREQPERNIILVDDYGDYAVVKINRPEKRNAVNVTAQRHLREALASVRQKKAVVRTGAGPAFCAGVDLTEARRQPVTEPASSQEVMGWTQCQADIRAHPAIFIAAVNGYALGGGSTLINSCELAVAAQSACIGTPEMGFGAFPLQAGPALIKRLLPKHAAQLIFTAQPVDAATALRMGLVNEVVPDDRVLSRASEIAQHIATFDATALDWGKKAFHQMQKLSWEDAVDYGAYTHAMIQRRRFD